MLRPTRLLCLLFALLVVPVAHADNWPMFGGDAGRSGLLAIGDGNPPLSALFASAQTSKPATPVVIAQVRGSDGFARTAFGTADGHTHVIRVAEGAAAVGAAAGVTIDDGPTDDTDTFSGEGTLGTLVGQGIAPVDTSTETQEGNFLFLHNDDGKIEIAQISVETGQKPTGADRVVDASGFTVSSSPVLTPPDDTGARVLFFLAHKPCDELPGVGCDPTGAEEETDLFRVPIADPASAAPSFGAATRVAVPGGNQLSSPTLVRLNDGGGNPINYIAVGANDAASVQTYRALDLAPGPKSGDLGDTAASVSVPVSATGLPAALAPSLFVAVGQSTDSATKVFRLTHTNGAAALTVADQGNAISGQPAQALAVTQIAGQGGGNVVVTTGKNVAVLDAGQLTSGVKLRFADDLAAGSTGFAANSPAVMGPVAYVSRDNGEPLALSLATAQPLAASQFTAQDTEAGSGAAGQPALGAGSVLYAAGKGIFGYQATTPAGPTVSVTPITVGEGDGVARFTITVAGRSQRTVRVQYATADGTAGGADYTPTSGTASLAPGQASTVVEVPIANDPIDEDDETFTLTLSSPEHAAIANASATATLVDDDTARLVVDDARIAEGNAGTRTLPFHVRLTNPSVRAVHLTYASADDTAHGGEDYDPVVGELSYAPGETDKTVAVTVHSDTAREPDEHLRLDIVSAEGAPLERGGAIGTIADDDTPKPTIDKRAKARGLLISLAPLIDHRAPYRFVIRGRLLLPKKIKRSAGCRGNVVLSLGLGDRTLTRHRVPVSHKTCRFSGAVKLKALPDGVRTQVLRAGATFNGNKKLRPLTAPTLLARLS